MNSCVKDILQDDFWIMPQTPEYIEEGIPYITSKNIKNGKIDFSKVNYISQEAFEKISKNRPILVGDILISMIGTLGETAEVTVNDGVFYGQNMFLVRLDESKVDKRYFLNYFKSNYVKRALTEKQNQSTQKYLKANHIEDLYIPVPTVEQQRNVACILDKISEIINFRKQQLQQLDELVKARFVEMFGDVANDPKYSGVSLGTICSTLSGGTPTTKVPEYYEGEIPWISTPFLGNNHIDGSSAKAYITEDAIINSATHLIPANTIMFGIRVGVGKSSIIDVPMCANQDIVALMGIDTNEFNLLFIKYVLDGYQSHFDSIKKGATILGITTDDLKKVIIPVVGIELQNQFATFVEQVDKSKVAVQKALDEAQTLFDSLMQEYFE